jgi:hypothetical protein
MYWSWSAFPGLSVICVLHVLVMPPQDGGHRAYVTDVQSFQECAGAVFRFLSTHMSDASHVRSAGRRCTAAAGAICAGR